MSSETARPPPASRTSLRWWWRPPAFLAGLALIAAALWVAGSHAYMPDEVREDRHRLARMANGRVLLLGASHGHSLMLDEAGLDGVDLAHGGQDLFEMAYIARTVKQRAPRLDTVFIALSYFSFVFDNAAYAHGDVNTRVGRRIGLYSAFGRLAFIPGDGNEYLKGVLFPLVTGDHFRSAFQHLPEVMPSFGGDSSKRKRDEVGGASSTPRHAKKGHSPGWKRKPRSWYEGHARGRCRQYSDLMRSMQQHHPGLSKDTFDLMLGLTKELEASSIHVVFFTPPYFDAYNQCFEHRYQTLTRESGRKLERLTHARYFDFSENPDFVHETRYYSNSDHFNRHGKVVFSHFFADALKARPPR